jgi:hypothetical protein
VRAKAGAVAEARITFDLLDGYHVNSNTPSDRYLIPLKLTWNPGPLTAQEVVYPKPSMEKYAFSEKPLSVFSKQFDLVTKFNVASDARPGPLKLNGKLRYQACNDRMCLPPRTLDVAVPVNILKP